MWLQAYQSVTSLDVRSFVPSLLDQEGRKAGRKAARRGRLQQWSRKWVDTSFMFGVIMKNCAKRSFE